MERVVTALLVALLLPGSHARNGELNFVVLGDWGGQPLSPYTTPAEVEVAEQMGKTASLIDSKFTMALGDNFYDTGVTDAIDPRFQETFEVRIYIVCSCVCCEKINDRLFLLCRKCSQVRLCSHVGTLCAGTMITMATPQQRLPTLNSPSDGSCQNCTTLR